MRAGEAADAASAALVVSFTEYAEHAAHSRTVQHAEQDKKKRLDSGRASGRDTHECR